MAIELTYKLEFNTEGEKELFNKNFKEWLKQYQSIATMYIKESAPEDPGALASLYIDFIPGF